MNRRWSVLFEQKDGLAEHFDDEGCAKELKAESQVSVHRNTVTMVDHCDDLAGVVSASILPGKRT